MISQYTAEIQNHLGLLVQFKVTKKLESIKKQNFSSKEDNKSPRID